ncbi:unnamed protein product [Caenorhabditis nigoni]
MSSESTLAKFYQESEVENPRLPCPFCESTYVHPGALKAHVLKKHQLQTQECQPKEKALSEELCCNLCDKTYFNKDSFRRHQKIDHKLEKFQGNVQISPLTSKRNDENVELNEFVADLSVYMENLRKVTIPHLPSTSISSPSMKLQAKKQGFRIIDILKAD